MKPRTILLAILLAFGVSRPSHGQTPPPHDGKPIDSLAWLAGGTWTADASSLGMKQIETRYRWSDNNAYLRFTTHFVTAQRTIHNYDGSFFWNRDQGTLIMWYMDAQGGITQSPAVADAATLVMRFRSTNFEGKPADLRVTVTRKGTDLYTWLLQEALPEAAWKQLASLDYHRTVDP